MPRENNSYLKMKDYFEDLVSKSVDVKSFAGYFRRELLNNMEKSDFESPYLALFDYELTFSGPEQNTISTRKIGFAVMYSNVYDDDLELQYQRIDDAEQIILEFMARMKVESADENHFLHKAFKKEGSIITPVELEDNSFGSEVTLEFNNNQSLKAHADKWTDDFLKC
ncbi:hypothetical protein [Chryseobacterium sp. YIM B08800]|uniref:hypothetical protein n=1 Tax=Chryseobacterium sp. YIM B08800 TaxID=2984136 RepID=UPI00223ED7C8|nr:hypothetical protein [Chryseobacterium sp. YIM B08800]